MSSYTRYMEARRKYKLTGSKKDRIRYLLTKSELYFDMIDRLGSTESRLLAQWDQRLRYKIYICENCRGLLTYYISDLVNELRDLGVEQLFFMEMNRKIGFY